MSDLPLPANPVPAPLRRSLRRKLLGWYDAHRRRLPWRDTGDPYRVLVSEFMLQQTRVAAVLPHFRRFLDRFPDLRSLAAAGDEAVCAAWSGLGYYRRARALGAAARVLVRDHGAGIPDDLDTLRSLPGVGDYTAAALASIVHDRPAAVVDGNVLRVLARLFAVEGSISRPAGARAVGGYARALLDPGRPGDWNQAVMELGATVCTPRAPRCEACPWEAACAARERNAVAAYPRRDPPKAPVSVQRALGVFRRGPRVLLVHREDPRLLDGTWEIPGLDLDPAARPLPALTAELARRFARDVALGGELVRIRHAITRRRFTVRAFAARAVPSLRADPGRRAWLDLESLDDYPVSSMTSKVLAALARLGEADRRPRPRS